METILATAQKPIFMISIRQLAEEMSDKDDAQMSQHGTFLRLSTKSDKLKTRRGGVYLTEFSYWYLSRMPRDLLAMMYRYLCSSWHYFDPPLLLKTLFAPWKRDSQPTDGLSLTARFSAAVENLMSRFLGAIVRAGTMGVGCLIVFFEGILFGFLLLLWYALPFIAVTLMALGTRLLIGG